MAKGEKTKLLWKDPEYRAHMIAVHKGKRPTNLAQLSKHAKSKKHREWLSQQHKGKPAWNKGIDMPELWDELHYAWKGDSVGYRSLHRWVESWLGKPSSCIKCGKTGKGRQIHWANKSGNYKRELDDWLRLCAKCHKAYDSKKMAVI